MTLRTLTPSRRWFSFSLRTLFIAMTLFGFWLSYQLNWARQRREFYEGNRALLKQAYSGWGADDPEPRRAPWLLWLFGEKGRTRLTLWVEGEDPDSLTARDLEKVKQAYRLFPEADRPLRVFGRGPSGMWGVKNRLGPDKPPASHK